MRMRTAALLALTLSAALAGPVRADDKPTQPGAAQSSGQAAGTSTPAMPMSGGHDMQAMMEHCRQMMAGSQAGGDAQTEKMRQDCDAMMKQHGAAPSGSKPMQPAPHGKKGHSN